MKKIILLVLLAFSAQSWAIDEAKGMASVVYKGKITPQLMQSAAVDAKYNALERYVAQSNSSKLRIFDARKQDVMARIDDFILSSTIIAQNDDKAMKTYSVTVRAEINNIRLQNLLNDNTGSAADSRGVMSGTDKSLVLIFFARSQDSAKSYDARTVSRVERKSSGSESRREGVSVANSESLGSGRESVSDSRLDTFDAAESSSEKVERGGSTELKDDKIQWKVSPANEINTAMTQVFLDSGLDVIEAEMVSGINLTSIRRDFGSGNDVSSENMRAMVSGTRNAGSGFVATGTMDIVLAGTDPQTGLKRVSITVNGKVYETSRGRTVGSVGPITAFGMGPTLSDAQRDGLRKASAEAAGRIVDQLNTKGF